ncbi:MAG: ferric reductase-like transmembrane domain-containing protein [Chloroflexota bacterium]
MSSAPIDQPRPVPMPRHWGIRPGDVAALLIGNGAFIVLMWIRHGALDELSAPGGVFTAFGQLAALLGTYLALIQLVFMGRSPWLDEAIGPDRLAWLHRWLGFGTVWLIGGHVVSTLVGWSIGDGRSVVAELVELLTGFPYVIWALAGFALFVMLGITSVRAARHRLSYEAWYWLHVYAYLGIALAFLHQVFVGLDFTHDALATAYWIGLYLIAAALVLVFRFGQPILLNRRHGLRVMALVPEAPGVTSIYVTGRDLDRLAARSGQYFILRFLSRSSWWRAHPYSLSSAPNGQWLRFTVKALGDDSARVGEVPVGTRVFLEGPYGILTGARRSRPKVTLIAGGIGISPIRALLESLAGRPGELTLLYRASTPADLVFRGELDLLAAHRGATIHYLVGRRGIDVPPDPFSATTIMRLVPDIADQDVYLCGPTDLMIRTEAALREIGVPMAQLHAERFTY